MPLDLPALALFIILAGYWMRVIRMVLKARRRGRDAHFVPREPVGRWLRILWYPVVALWVIHPLVNAFVARPQAAMRPVYDLPAIRWLAVAIAAFAFGATYLCWRQMGRSWRMGIDPAE